MAIIKHFEAIQAKPMLDGVTMRLVIGPDQGAPFFNMRIFDLKPGSATPHHKHWWEHEVYILEGQGIVKTESGDTLISAGYTVFVPGEELHQFVNTSDTVFRFICLVPQEWMENVKGQEKAHDMCC
jgi:quercetin dioxygenase-like cupin family protein